LKREFSYLAEVVGSTPTRSISFILVNYGITLSSISIIVGQKPGDDAMQYYAVCRHFCLLVLVSIFL
jgi:hypothetical protein